MKAKLLFAASKIPSTYSNYSHNFAQLRSIFHIWAFIAVAKCTLLENIFHSQRKNAPEELQVLRERFEIWQTSSYPP